MKRKKRSLWKRVCCLLLLAALVCGLAFLPTLTKNSGEEKKESILRSSVQPRTMEKTVSAAAVLEIPEEETVTFSSGVSVTELLVQNGDEVTQGQLLARVDTVSVMKAVMEVQNTLDSLQNQMQQKSNGLSTGAVHVGEDGKIYAGSTLIPSDKLADYASYQQLAEQYSDYETLLLELLSLNRDGTINASCDGIIDQLDVTLPKKEKQTAAAQGSAASSAGAGQYPQAANMQQNTNDYSLEKTTLCSILPMQTITVNASVDEEDVASLTVGMEAAVSVYALPDLEVQGTITEISQFGTSSGGNGKFAVRLAIPYEKGMLPGMNADVSICIDTLESVPTVPVASVVDVEGRTVAYTGYDARKNTLLSPVEVTLGWSDGSYAQVLTGLSAGDEIYYAYYQATGLPQTLPAEEQ